VDDEALLKMADEAEHETGFVRRRRRMEDFRYDERQAKFWDITTGSLLVAPSVDGAIPREWWPTTETTKGKLKPYKPSIAINDVDTGLTVEGSTWWPGKPAFIHDVVIDERGMVPQKGASCYNTYKAPDHSNLNTDKTPELWIEHVKKLWPDPVEYNHFFDYAAHMLQRPDQKVNHGIVLAGSYGIGKDTALLPMRWGVGEHNTAEIEPDAIAKQYNGYVKSVLLVINEVRPHDEDVKASAFYDQLKPILAAPPDMLPMEVKYANVVYIRNLCHTILTTNEPLKMYIPAADRRLFVMTSKLPDPKVNPVFKEAYFQEMIDYLYSGGIQAAVKWLLERDILHFNSGEAPPMTWGKRAIITSSDNVRRSIADEVIEQYLREKHDSFRPKVIFAKDIIMHVNEGKWFDDEKAALSAVKAKNFHFKMDEHGYDMVRNPDAQEWSNGKYRSRAAFVDKTVPHDDQLRVIKEALNGRSVEF
jgi:hypothetical protein